MPNRRGFEALTDCPKSDLKTLSGKNVIEKLKHLTNDLISASTQERIVESSLNLKKMADINKLLN